MNLDKLAIYTNPLVWVALFCLLIFNIAKAAIASLQNLYFYHVKIYRLNIEQLEYGITYMKLILEQNPSIIQAKLMEKTQVRAQKLIDQKLAEHPNKETTNGQEAK